VRPSFGETVFPAYHLVANLLVLGAIYSGRRAAVLDRRAS
jgi:hypothetical protein